MHLFFVGKSDFLTNQPGILNMSLVDSVRDAGIIGCGGAGFPTHVKIDSKVNQVFANGAECEPLLNSDQRIMEQQADELIEGLGLIMKHVGASKGFIGLKKTYKDSIAALTVALKKADVNIELGLLDACYPSGDEHIMITDITGKVVPEGGIPLQVNALVSNVLTMVQVARAARGQVVTDRAVTLVGEIFKPQVVNVAIGTPIRDLIEFTVPLVPVEDMVVIAGGPMMGPIVSVDDVINKTTSGLLFLQKDHPLVQIRSIPMDAMVRRSVAACCQCRMCTDACSRYLQGHDIEPHLMMRVLAYKTDVPTRGMTGAFLCSQCGLCEFACPMDLSPRRAFVDILNAFRSAGVKNPHTKAPLEPHEFREFRKIAKDRLTRRYGLLKYDRHDLVLTQFPEPPVVRLSLTQAIGAPSEPVVGVGDRVAKGALVAKIPDGKLGSMLHASIDGTITGISDEHITIEGAK